MQAKPSGCARDHVCWLATTHWHCDWRLWGERDVGGVTVSESTAAMSPVDADAGGAGVGIGMRLPVAEGPAGVGAGAGRLSGSAGKSKRALGPSLRVQAPRPDVGMEDAHTDTESEPEMWALGQKMARKRQRSEASTERPSL
jgi:hypothetical protein